MSKTAEYINRYKIAAIRASIGTGILPSIILAQGALESGNGASVLAAKYNNHFGIKADSRWPGQKVNLQTREVYNGQSVMEGHFFRVYPTVKKSFFDHSLFLLQNPRYAKAGVFNARNAQEQIQAIKNAGYATDPAYVSKIMNIVRTHDLERVDNDARLINTIGSIALVFFSAYSFGAASSLLTV